MRKRLYGEAVESLCVRFRALEVRPERRDTARNRQPAVASINSFPNSLDFNQPGDNKITSLG